jgi:hypothetical protein
MKVAISSATWGWNVPKGYFDGALFLSCVFVVDDDDDDRVVLEEKKQQCPVVAGPT